MAHARYYTASGRLQSRLLARKFLGPRTQIGAVAIGGNWTSSNLVAGP